MDSQRTDIVTWHGDRRHVAYRGFLTGNVRVHYGFDGWSEPVREAPLEPDGSGCLVAAIDDPGGSVAVDMAFTDGDAWDNNYDANYRLWIDIEPVDCHLHAADGGMGRLGFASLGAAMRSAGITTGVVSSMRNELTDELLATTARLNRLVWVRPHNPTLDWAVEMLVDGYVGVKLHPSYDNFMADDRELDPYMIAVRNAHGTVAVHSAPMHSDPDLIRRLAERFPTVPFVLYHTYLGPAEGRRRAVRHAQQVPNMYLETSWCPYEEILQFVDDVGPDRVLFGSDAAVDGPGHYVHTPANISGPNTYNSILVALAQHWPRDVTHKVLAGNARRLFRL